MTAKEISLDENGFATEAGFITVYSYDGETREYLSSSVEYLPFGVGVPANSCVDAPISKKDGFAIRRNADLTGWEYVADHRGETVYNTENGDEITIAEMGEYPENTTTIAPLTPYDKWNGEKWVTDTVAQHAADIATADADKQARIDQANNYMDSKQWPGKAALGRLTDTEKEQYNQWLDYLDELEAIDTSSAPDVEWPACPEE